MHLPEQLGKKFSWLLSPTVGKTKTFQLKEPVALPYSFSARKGRSSVK